MDNDTIKDLVKRPDKPGVYVLYSLKDEIFYVGRAGAQKGLKGRLQTHCSKKEYDLFNCKNFSIEKDAEIAECALYHYFRSKIIPDNERHPKLKRIEQCPYCGQKKS